VVDVTRKERRTPSIVAINKAPERRIGSTTLLKIRFPAILRADKELIETNTFARAPVFIAEIE
jgi:hypothetical protein